MLGGKRAYLRVGFVSRGPIGGEIWYPTTTTSTETELGGHSMSSVTKKNPNLKFMSWILLEIWHYVQKTDLFLDFKFFWDWSNGFGVMTGQSFEI